MRTETMVYRYKIKSTGASSAKFGPCERCNKHATEVFLQTEQLQYELDDNDIKTLAELGRLTDEERTTRKGWTAYQCKNLFGHEQCLIDARR